VDLAEAFAELGDLTGPLPELDASDEAWAMYGIAEEFEAMLAGMVSRPGEPRDRDYVARLRELLADPSLQRGLGERLGKAEALVDALSQRRR